MAGNYPDVPGHRFVMDRDGTQLYHKSSDGTITQRTPTDIETISDDRIHGNEHNFPSGNSNLWLLFYFPEPRTISGIFAAHRVGNGSISSWTPEYSTDTTNGIDGTWSPVAGLTSPNLNSIVPQYRTGIQPVSISSAKAFRMTWNQNLGDLSWAVHIYGSIPTTGSPNRLAIWHPTLDEPIGGAYFDWGDSPRSSSADRTFRVKNLSASLTANDITLSFDALTDGSPSVAGMHLVSDDGTTFAATETIPSLGPGVISSVMTMRRVLASNAPLGLWAPRIHAAADSWS